MIIIFLFFHSSSIACGGVAAAHIFSICVKKGAWCSGAPFEFAAEKKMKQGEGKGGIILIILIIHHEPRDGRPRSCECGPQTATQLQAGCG